MGVSPDARMRPLTGRAARERDCSAREVPQDTTPTTSRASPRILARPFRPDLREIGRFEGLRPDSWESRPEHVEGLDLQPDTHGR